MGKIKRLKFGKRWMLYLPDHPKSNSSGYIGEHRIIIEKKIGGILGYYDCVHHKNGDTLDNRDDNLELLSRRKHTQLHNLERATKIEIFCACCNKKIIMRQKAYDWKKKNNKNIFCSRKCIGKYY